jgi:hypothetical protein
VVLKAVLDTYLDVRVLQRQLLSETEVSAEGFVEIFGLGRGASEL